MACYIYRIDDMKLGQSRGWIFATLLDGAFPNAAPRYVVLHFFVLPTLEITREEAFHFCFSDDLRLSRRYRARADHSIHLRPQWADRARAGHN